MDSDSLVPVHLVAMKNSVIQVCLKFQLSEEIIWIVPR